MYLIFLKTLILLKGYIDKFTKYTHKEINHITYILADLCILRTLCSRVIFTDKAVKMTHEVGKDGALLKLCFRYEIGNKTQI